MLFNLREKKKNSFLSGDLKNGSLLLKCWDHRKDSK